MKISIVTTTFLSLLFVVISGRSHCFANDYLKDIIDDAELAHSNISQMKTTVRCAESIGGKHISYDLSFDATLSLRPSHGSRLRPLGVVQNVQRGRSHSSQDV